MIVSRESIYAALFAQLQGALLTPAGPFKTVSRHWQDPSQISAADRPALFQVQTEETAQTSQRIAGLPLNWNLKVDLVIYSSGDASPNTIPSTELNGLNDAVEIALQSINKGSALTLGGTVYNCRLDGKIPIVENVNGMMAMSVFSVLLVQGS